MKIRYQLYALGVIIFLNGCAAVDEPDTAGVMGGKIGGVAGVLPSAVRQVNAVKSGSNATSDTKTSVGKNPSANPTGK